MTALPLRARTVTLALCAALATIACQRAPGEPPPPPTQPHTGGMPSGTPSGHAMPDPLPMGHPPIGAGDPAQPTGLPPGHPAMPAGGMPPGMMAPPSASANSLLWTDPTGWQRETPSSAMRRGQFRIPRATGDDADAEMSIFTFGPGQGGAVEANLDRWYGQVQQPDGRSSREVGQRTSFPVGPFTVTVIDVPGRIGGGGMPGMPAAATFEHGRLLAAVVETPDGPWFFKMTGPDHTVAAARPAFETMLRSMHAAGGAPSTATARDQ